MQQSSYKRNSSDIRRLLNYSFISVSGHFGKKSIQLPGKVNNWWYGIFNIKTRKVIVLYRMRQDILIVMYRKKSPYYSLINDILHRQSKAKMLISRRIPKINAIRWLNYTATGMRSETKAQRQEHNRKLGMVYKRFIHERRARETTPSTDRSTIE